MPGLLLISLATLVMPTALFSRRNKDAWLDELDGIRADALVAPEGETANAMDQVGSLADTGLEPGSEQWPDDALADELGRLEDDGRAAGTPPSVEPAPHRAYPAEMWHPGISAPQETEDDGAAVGSEVHLGSADLLPDEAAPARFRFASLRAVEPLGADSTNALRPAPTIPTPVGEPVVDVPISWAPSPVEAPAAPPAPPVESLPPPPVPHPFAMLPFADDGSGSDPLPPPTAPTQHLIGSPLLPPIAPTSTSAALLGEPAPADPPAEPAEERFDPTALFRVEETAAPLAGEPLAAEPLDDAQPVMAVDTDAVTDGVDGSAEHPRLPAWAIPPDVPLIPEPIPGVGGSLITGPVARRGRTDGGPVDRSIQLPAHLEPVGREAEGAPTSRVLPVDDDGTVELAGGLLRLGPGVRSEVRLDDGRIRVELTEGWCWASLGTESAPATLQLPTGTLAVAEGSTTLVSVEADVTFVVVASGAAVLVEPSGSTVLPGGSIALCPLGEAPQVDQATPTEIAAEPLVAQNRALDAGRS